VGVDQIWEAVDLCVNQQGWFGETSTKVSLTGHEEEEEGEKQARGMKRKTNQCHVWLEGRRTASGFSCLFEGDEEILAIDFDHL